MQNYGRRVFVRERERERERESHSVVSCVCVFVRAVKLAEKLHYFLLLKYYQNSNYILI